jgi:hypothetical protein
LLILSAILLILMTPNPSRAQAQVDLALVLAVDSSYSMDLDEEELQRQGYVEAFRSSMVHSAIHQGALGRIAVIYFEWAGPSGQWVVVPWTFIGAPEDAIAFAERLARKSPTPSLGGTSISGAIDFSLQLLASHPFKALRQVIDISGDGINSHGRPVTQARDEAVGRGITINGLPIGIKRSEGPTEATGLDAYYRSCVIGGQGAFIVPVRERRQMTEAIRTKIVWEIANAPVPPPMQTVQMEARLNCQAETYRHNPMR